MRITSHRYSLAFVLLAFVLGLAVSCTSSSSDKGPSQPGFGGPLGFYEHEGLDSIEERIAGADVIVRVRLRSVSPTAYPQVGGLEYRSALEHRFEALEYLKGSGGGEIVAEVYELRLHKTMQDATENANALLAERDAQWDGREAIVFLLDDSLQEDRYVLGIALTGDPYPLNKDYYTIASTHSKRWLPSASDGATSGAAAGASDAQRFLLDAPSGAGEGGASGQAEAEPTITLGELKAKIAAIERVATAGGGSEEYRNCLYAKYKWERQVRERKEAMGGNYFYLREDEAMTSGLSAGTQAYTGPFAESSLRKYGETAPPTVGEFLIIGRDKDLFSARWPGVVDTARPLPTGEYKFYYSERPQRYVICDAHPEEEQKRLEVFVTVTAPAGTLHEAFFDPATIGTAVGADGTNGALSPTAFTIGGVSTALQALKWESGTLTLELSSAAALAGHTLDFIALDGSVALSLDAGAATVSGGTLTWSVADQPWQAGDLLMLRIRQA